MQIKIALEPCQVLIATGWEALIIYQMDGDMAIDYFNNLFRGDLLASRGPKTSGKTDLFEEDQVESHQYEKPGRKMG